MTEEMRSSSVNFLIPHISLDDYKIIFRGKFFIHCIRCIFHKYKIRVYLFDVIILRNIKDHDFHAFLSKRMLLARIIWPLRYFYYSFLRRESLFSFKHPHFSRALPQFRSPISIFIFRNAAEISGAALHERSRSKPRDKTCQPSSSTLSGI